MSLPLRLREGQNLPKVTQELVAELGLSPGPPGCQGSPLFCLQRSQGTLSEGCRFFPNTRGSFWSLCPQVPCTGKALPRCP